MADPNPSKLSQSSLLSDKDMAKFDKSSKTNVARSSRAVMGGEGGVSTSKSSTSVASSNASTKASGSQGGTAAGAERSQKIKLALAVVFLLLAGVLIAYTTGLLSFQQMADAKKYADPLADIPVEQREEVRKEIEAQQNAPPPAIPPAAS